MSERMDGKKRRSYILSFIARFIEAYGYSPSYREIGKAVHLASSSTVKDNLEILKKQGLIDFNPSSPRTIRIKK